ncbi:Cation/calcium exchanger 1 [Acorus gramineus]|uniref:Cation/calcium exchanger 1 n=1 Tax=Acorus gramineus TaxID=55184 RepID=A0AAV9AJK5_ACOGR|nr:Cation/calcium exchanger 1 [Acorus gramineus]
MASSLSHKYYILLNLCFLFGLCFIFKTHHLITPNLPTLSSPSITDGCEALDRFKDPETKCWYIKHNNPCVNQGYINYLHLFYCVCGGSPLLGYALLVSWLLVLFYLLGNTASEYFCSSLESLSRLLHLSPSLAGVTLLSLGNGAPDVFASIVSFTGAGGSANVGLGSVLGGALFVSTVVVGVISLYVGERRVPIDRSSFFRDACFLVAAASLLLVVFVVGRINVFGAIAFVALYVVYVVVVSTTHLCNGSEKQSNSNSNPSPPECDELGAPLLGFVDEEKPKPKPTLIENDDPQIEKSELYDRLRQLVWVLGLPLYLPRRLTIPDASEENWSKPYAVASATFSPILLAFIWNSQIGESKKLAIYVCSALLGATLGSLALVTTERENPPRKCSLPWVAGGFMMSVTWAYITAKELVGLLVSLARVLGIPSSVLALTVLAWGNSIGDLMTNVAMAVNGGPEGVQVAISGCYAGPVFNVLVGLGVSMMFAAGSARPGPYLVKGDSSLYETVAFLVGGVLWVGVMLPRRGMRPDRVVGGGLLALYLCFLCTRLAQTLGLVK